MKDDEKYLEGINLVTGDKIDYARHILVLPSRTRPKHKSMLFALVRRSPKSTNLFGS